MQAQTGGAFLKAKSTEFRTKTRVQHDDVHLIVLSFYNHENRLHKAVFVVYEELSGGAKMTADEIKQMILDEIVKYIKSNEYKKITSEDLKNLAEAYSLLKGESEKAFTPSSRISYYS